jgi:hypothetical protein
MSLPPDIIHEIAQHCDDKTYMNMCLISKDVHQRERAHLLELESFSLIQKIKWKTLEMFYENSKHTKLKIAHQAMRIFMNHLHVLRLPEQKNNIFNILMKLDEFQKGGMSARKVKEYQFKLLSCF